MSCFQIAENTFELLVYRFKPIRQSHLKDAIDEMIEVFSLSTIELDFFFHEGNLQQFYGKYVEMQEPRETHILEMHDMKNGWRDMVFLDNVPFE